MGNPGAWEAVEKGAGRVETFPGDHPAAAVAALAGSWAVRAAEWHLPDLAAKAVFCTAQYLLPTLGPHHYCPLVDLLGTRSIAASSPNWSRKAQTLLLRESAATFCALLVIEGCLLLLVHAELEVQAAQQCASAQLSARSSLVS